MIGTREAIISLRELLERTLEFNRYIHIDFIGLEKAFDSVRRKCYNRRTYIWIRNTIILNSYKNQKTTVEINGNQRKARIRKVVRQGYYLSPYLFIFLLKTQ